MINRPVSTRELQALMTEARLDPAKEEIFLRALLNATVYAHVPKTRPPAGRMQFIQFRWPENEQLVLPVFSGKDRADVAAAGKVGVIAMSGRHLLMLTQGATLILDPNNEGVTLYPAEVQALLSGRPLAPAPTLEVISEDVLVQVRTPGAEAADLCALLNACFDQDKDVTSAYMVEVHRGEHHEDIFLLVFVIADPRRSEHIARTCGQRLNHRPIAPLPVTFKFHPPGTPLPTLCRSAIQIFDRMGQKVAN